MKWWDVAALLAIVEQKGLRNTMVRENIVTDPTPTLMSRMLHDSHYLGERKIIFLTGKVQEHAQKSEF